MHNFNIFLKESQLHNTIAGYLILPKINVLNESVVQKNMNKVYFIHQLKLGVNGRAQDKVLYSIRPPELYTSDVWAIHFPYQWLLIQFSWFKLNAEVMFWPNRLLCCLTLQSISTFNPTTPNPRMHHCSLPCPLLILSSVLWHCLPLLIHALLSFANTI